MTKYVLTDGSTTEGGVVADLNGYGIIRATSIEEAAKLAMGCPHLHDDATIQISEALEL